MPARVSTQVALRRDGWLHRRARDDQRGSGRDEQAVKIDPGRRALEGDLA